MSWVTLADSHIGGREEQQDRYLIVQSKDGKNQLLVVADGAGGHKAGAMAAQTVIDYISQNLEQLWLNNDPEALINKLIIECNKLVLKVGDKDLACTTLVLVLIRNDEVYWGHVGDSRFYLIRDGKVIIQTKDHSRIEHYRQQEAQDAECASGIPSNELYMCLGAVPDISPEIASCIAREGDTLMLCSDGLWDQVNMNHLVADLGERPVTVQSVKKWVNKASIAKSANSDNITLVAAQFIKTARFSLNLFNTISRLFKKQ